jgi:hypothetical protein
VSPSGGEYESGLQITLIATPASGYIFVNWTGDVGTVGDVNAATTNITLNLDYTILPLISSCDPQWAIVNKQMKEDRHGVHV